MGTIAPGLVDPGFVLRGRTAPPPAAETERRQHDRSLEEGEMLIALRRYREALGVLKRIVVNEPRDGEAWTLVAQAHLGREEHEEALRAALTAAELCVESEPHRLACVALVALERFDEAIAQAAEAVRLDPDDWCNYVEQARALVRLPERIRDARAAVRMAVQLAPHKAVPHLVAGQVEAAGGELELAAKEFRQVFTIDPANPAAYNELARLHLHGGATCAQASRRRLLSGRRER